MSTEPAVGMPRYLAELLSPTPSGVAKLIAAWDSLHSETLIAVLTTVEKGGMPAYLANKIRLKAFDSTNAYLRYLAVRGASLSDDNDSRTLKERIESDPEPLVRYARLESEFGALDFVLKDPEAFLALDHEARLAKVRQLHGSGKKIADIIGHAVDHHLRDGRISEIELYEILADYLRKPSFREWYSDERVHKTEEPLTALSAGEDIESLWRLVPKVPDAVSLLLIQHLPQAAGLCSGIPDDVLRDLTDLQLITLLDREEIPLKEVRKEIFVQKDKWSDAVRSAAVWAHFDLGNDEFAAVLDLPEKERIGILRDLAPARHLRLCVYHAISDILRQESETVFGSGAEAAIARDTAQLKLTWLEGYRREREIREVRLYRLAAETSGGSDSEVHRPGGKLHFLADSIVPGNTLPAVWATFAAFCNVWERLRDQERRKLERYLPRIPDIDSEEVYRGDDPDGEIDPPVTKADSARIEQAIQCLEKRLTALDGKLEELQRDENGWLSTTLRSLSSEAAQSRESVATAIAGLRTELMNLQAAHSRQRLLSYTVIALIIAGFLFWS